MKWKESVLDKENELQVMVQENEELRAREASSLKRIEELSKLLEEATSKVQPAGNGDLSDCEEDYDLLPKEVDNPLGVDSSLRDEADEDEGVTEEVDITNGTSKPLQKGCEEEKEEAEREYKMWESCKIEKKELSAEGEMEQEPAAEEEEEEDEELEAKADEDESLDQENRTSASEHAGEGAQSPSLNQNPKKKKPLLRKFGSLLKKKGGSTPTKQKEEI
ncbi:hypothetical protein MLD38_008902 [Melastoma candidum]|nr:hypothetical protein MLD38_008902 [Melastoma candidum]